MRIPNTLVAAAVLAVAVPAPAATDDAIAACRALREPSARLACYDALPLAAVPPAPAAAPSAAAPATAAPPPAPANEAARFGLPATSRAPSVDSVDSRIEGHFAGWYPGTRIRLANGQVWQVTDGTSRFADVDNPKVTVRRGAMGSFFLDIDGVNPSPRVRRVE
jgi:hypothetical protein